MSVLPPFLSLLSHCLSLLCGVKITALLLFLRGTQVIFAESFHVMSPDCSAADNLTPATPSRSHMIDRTSLNSKYYMQIDHSSTFHAPTHTYTVDGVVAQRSATGLLDDLFECFDAFAVLATYYNRWKKEEDPRYWSIIGFHRRADGSIDDEKAKLAIAASWQDKGVQAASVGTEFHFYAERVLSKEHAVLSHRITLPAVQFASFLSSDFYRLEHCLVPFRTELIVWCKIDSVLVAAGQIDALFVGSEGFYIFDWKCVESKKDLSSTAQPFQGRMGRGIAEKIPDTPHHRYSLQTSLYAEMLKSSHKIDVGARMYLLRVHSSVKDFELVRCTDFREEASALLLAEYTRLLSSSAQDSCAEGCQRPTKRVRT